MPPKILPTSGNLLNFDVQAFINCVGIMGMDLALQFKQANPASFADYRVACRRGEIQPGRLFGTKMGATARPSWLIQFPTKWHFRDSSLQEDVESGLMALSAEVQTGEIRLLALGCGLGGLDWRVVRPLIADAFATLTKVRVLLYGPKVRATKEPEWV